MGAVRGSHLGSVSSVSSMLLEAGWLAGSGGSARSLISITSLRRCCCRRHCPLRCPSTLLLSSSSILLHPTSAVEPVNTNHPFYCNSPSVSIYLCISFHLPVLLFLSPLVSQTHMHIQRSSRQADSAGFVMNGILLHIRRKYTLQCGFVSIVLGMTHSTLQRMAVSQTVRQTD